MPRKYKSTERFLTPDPKYNNLLVQKFINCVMKKGKKSTAEKLFYDAMDIIKERIKDVEPLEVFTKAVTNVKPLIEVRSRRVGGATYQVPVEVPRKRQTYLAISWILEAARNVKGKPMHLKLANELIAAYKKEGASITKRENVHKMAEANKAFAHFAW
jgi:small subunit ribosomal protein S7